MAPRRIRSAARSTGTSGPDRRKSPRRSSACRAQHRRPSNNRLRIAGATARPPANQPGGSSMRRMLVAALLSACASAAIAVPTPKDQLLTPPADATHYVVVSMAGKHGDQWAWTQADGSLATRYSQSLRGWITEVDEVMTLGADGTPGKLMIRGITPSGDAAETFAVADSKAIWKSAADSGEAAAAPAFYLATGGTNLANMPLAAALVKAGSAGVALYPSGRATLEKAGTLSITGPDGPKTVQLAWIRGISPSPQ